MKQQSMDYPPHSLSISHCKATYTLLLLVFFNKYPTSPPYHQVGNPRMWRADYVHCSMPFYLDKGLEHPLIWGRRSRNLSPMDTEGQLWQSFGGVKSYMRIFYCVGGWHP